MKILVLGGTGWVGHQVVRQYHAAGHDVTIGSRGQKSTFCSDIPCEVTRVTLDKNSEPEMAALLTNGYEIVIDTVPSEASIDCVFLHARGLKHYIQCSSTGGYTPLQRVPGDETLPFEAAFGAGWGHKRVVDGKVMALFREQGFPATVLRPCYITGPGALPLDNLGGRRKDFIPDILREAVLDLPNDGRALLQPIHVVELARSFLLCAETDACLGQIYNICMAKAIPLSRYLEITAVALGKKAVIQYIALEEMLVKYRDCADETGLRFMAEHMCFDIAKARSQLGFHPRFSTEETIEETARWAAGL